MYRRYCSVHDVKPYLMQNMECHLKYVTTRFRLGISDLTVHHFRYRDNVDLLCPLCKENTEDELHFVLCCPALSTIREKFIPPKYYREPCLFKLCLLMSSTRHADVRNLSIFLHRAFRLREIATS
eukprot:TRINITY_DN35980_c0_g1_i11.p1 TRINITY_DN35980_c0_g1~~TRINITY_DN35980_c0_g1_i11.p1  ORF type:complete len:144 (-),score=3.67 TRINITY_DN35980_c0_g1_i11:64-438(-)